MLERVPLSVDASLAFRVLKALTRERYDARVKVASLDRCFVVLEINSLSSERKLDTSSYLVVGKMSTAGRREAVKMKKKTAIPARVTPTNLLVE